MLDYDFREIPVLLIGYSRIGNIERMVNELIQLEVKNIYVAIDHSNNSKIYSQQQELVEKLRIIGINHQSTIQVWLRKKNHGVGPGIMTSLDWFFSFNSAGVILEDDLIFDKHFLQYCAEGIEKYVSEPEIWILSGNRFNSSEGNTDVALTNYPQIWGWASWRDRWIEMREAILVNKALDPRQLGNPTYCYFYVGARRAQAGFIDTWDLPLAFEMYRQRKICILPPVNLVSNVGTDIHSVHTTEEGFPLHFPIAAVEHINFLDVEDLKKSSDEINIFLEEYIFKISKRHILSVPKYWLSMLVNRFSENKKKSLAMKLEEADRFESD